VDEYDGRQYVGIDLHKRRSVIVRMTRDGERLGRMVRIDSDPFELGAQVASWGEAPEVVLEATYGWYWAADVLADAGATVHLAHPLGVKGFAYRRVKNDERDASDLADLLRMGRLPEAWIAPPEVRGLREAVRHRCKLVALRSGLKAQAHSVLAKQGTLLPMSDIFSAAGRKVIDELQLDPPVQARVLSLLRLIDAYTFEIDVATKRVTAELSRHRGYRAIQSIPGRRPGPGCRVRRRDRRRHPLPRPAAAVLLGGHDTPAPRVGHEGPPRTNNQAGQQPRPVGRRRGRPEDPPRTDCQHEGQAGRAAGQQHRQGRRRPRTAHPCLLRTPRRTHPLPDQATRGVMSTTKPGVARLEVVCCLTPHLSAVDHT
jgi:transposase